MIRIKPSERNTNKHTEQGMELLQKSIEKVGVIESISVADDGTIISGHARKEVFDKKGMRAKEIELADDEFAVLKTKIKANSKEYYEAQILANTTGHKNYNLDIEEIEIIAEEYGIDIQEIGVEGVESEDQVLEAVEDDFDQPLPEHPITVLGDLYEIGEHRLLCGDSTDSDQVAKLMDGKKADMVFTDPPYNVDYEGKTKEKLKIQNDKHSLSEFRMFISDVISNLVIFTKKGGSYYVCIPLEVGVTDLFLEKTHLQSVIIWLKNVIVMGRKDYQQKTEPILFLTNQEEETEYTEEETYDGIVYGWNFGDSHKYYGGRKQSNVWNFDKPQRNGEHPTMKPILLVAKAINNSSKVENIVIDLFLGSGSTMVASHQLKRKCYGMELDPKYCDVIVKRMLNLDSSLTVKRNGVDCKAEFLA
jgi:DNA modification methylase